MKRLQFPERRGAFPASDFFHHAIAAVLLAAAMLAAPAAFATDYTWLDSPENGNWDLSSLNWSGGTGKWEDGNSAIFPTPKSSVANITLNATRTAADVTFNGGEYVLQGSYPLVVTGKVFVNSNSRIYNGFGGTSVRIDGGSNKILYWRNSAGSTISTTYLEGGVIIRPSTPLCFGPAPASPTDNIIVAGGNPAIYPEQNGGTIDANRTIRISPGATLRLGAVAANMPTFTLKNRIAGYPDASLGYTTNTCVNLWADWSSWDANVVFDPGAGKTNDIGRLNVGSRLTIKSGVTRVGAYATWKTDAYAPLYVVGKNGAYNDIYGNLAVDGGTLFCSQGSRHIAVNGYGQVKVANGGKFLMPSIDYVNASGSGAKLTVSDGGVFDVLKLRLSYSASKAGSGEIHLDEGGLMRVRRIHAHDSNGYSGVFAFNGGSFQSTCTSDSDAKSLFEGSAWQNIRFTVGAKGAVMDSSNGVNIYWKRPLTSGATPDGGLKKRGSGVLVLMAANTYNGKTVVESGDVQARVDNALPSGTALRMGGAGTHCDLYSYNEPSPARNTAQSLSRIEGSGNIRHVTALTVNGSVAPDAGGTLSLDAACSLSATSRYEATPTAAAAFPSVPTRTSPISR